MKVGYWYTDEERINNQHLVKLSLFIEITGIILNYFDLISRHHKFIIEFTPVLRRPSLEDRSWTKPTTSLLAPKVRNTFSFFKHNLVIDTDRPLELKLATHLQSIEQLFSTAVASRGYNVELLIYLYYISTPAEIRKYHACNMIISKISVPLSHGPHIWEI